MEIPIPFVIFQLNDKIEKNTSISIQNNRVIEQTIPALVTGTGFPNTNVYSNQGIGNPTVTSKMLLPTEEDTAMSPNPFLATITLVIRSGMEVPAARKVKPITSGGIPAVFPVTVAHQTIR